MRAGAGRIVVPARRAEDGRAVPSGNEPSVIHRAASSPEAKVRAPPAITAALRPDAWASSPAITAPRACWPLFRQAI